MIKFSEPYPFRFNPWKHHLNWISTEISESLKNTKSNEIGIDLLQNIQSLNSNQIDIYTGKIQPIDIINEIKSRLDCNVMQNRQTFKLWLNKEEFKLVNLSDTSVWVLREGNMDKNFIHLHPARTTPCSVRIHGNSLKTAILHIILYKDKPILLNNINLIRASFLGLSPVKDLKTCERINRTIHFLNENTQVHLNP